MTRAELKELHYITAVSNLPSIMKHGLLSHKRAEKVSHYSVAMPEIQERRAKKIVPGGRPLHDYVNLYICARNKMLSKVRDRHVELCVLRIDPAVLGLPGVIVSDQNASSDYVRFASAPEGLFIVNAELVFAEYWTHPDDPILEFRHGSIKCAEVLVPDRLDAGYIQGAYVSGVGGKRAVEAAGTTMAVSVDAHLFFR
jgi:hypothetical protein